MSQLRARPKGSVQVVMRFAQAEAEDRNNPGAATQNMLQGLCKPIRASAPAAARPPRAATQPPRREEG